MSGEDREIEWRKLREFADVDLEHSFVLSWQFESDTLFIDIDLLLLPEHPFYEPPRPAEKLCIRPALVEFPFCVAVRPAGVETDGDVRISIAGLGGGAISGLTAAKRSRAAMFTSAHAASRTRGWAIKLGSICIAAPPKPIRPRRRYSGTAAIGQSRSPASATTLGANRSSISAFTGTRKVIRAANTIFFIVPFLTD